MPLAKFTHALKEVASYFDLLKIKVRHKGTQLLIAPVILDAARLMLGSLLIN